MTDAYLTYLICAIEMAANKTPRPTAEEHIHGGEILRGVLVRWLVTEQGPRARRKGAA